MFYRDTIVAGKTIMRSLKAVARIDSETKKRKAKTNPTSEAVRKINFNNAVKILAAKLNHNFKPGDYHLTLTYKEAASTDEAQKALNKFIRNIRNYCKKEGIEFKWVAVTEYRHKRLHHHIVMTKIDTSVINKYWKHGYEYQVSLDDTGNYKKLAEYLLKETEKTFRDDDSPVKRRYSTSRNVAMPEIKREKVTGREVYKEIKALKGYYIDEDTVRRYEHAILGVECLEYTMISIDDEPRIKRWPKGKAVSPRASYKDFEKQISFDDLLP